MKKKLLALLICVFMLVSLASCGEKADSGESTSDQQISSQDQQEPEKDESKDTATDTDVTNTTEDEPETVDPDTENVEDQDGAEDQSHTTIEVEKNLFDVVITLPADFIGEDATQESLEASIADNDGITSVTLNSDGSATYKMTKAAHAELMEDVKSEIDADLEEMVNGEDYSFTAIDHNDDYTKFTVTTDEEELGLTDSFSVIAFYMYGGMYAAYNGNSVDDIQVDFVNAATGEIIDTAHSSDLEES